MQYTQPLIGNSAVQVYLQKMVKSGIVPHAQLWVGPTHVGKSTFLTNFIFERMCLQPSVEGKACTRCQNCRLLKHDNYPLLQWVDGEALAMNELKAIIADAALTQLVAGQRWLVIDQADQLSPAVSNALLKLLEEPRTDLMIVLLAHDDEAILPTVRSRCSLLRFQTVPTSELLNAFPQVAQQLPLANGLPGKAHQLAQPVLRSKQAQLLEECRSAIKASPVERLAWVSTLYPDKKTADLATVLDTLELAIYEAQFEQTAQAQRVQALRLLQHTRLQLKQNGQPKLVLTNLLLNLPTTL